MYSVLRSPLQTPDVGGGGNPLSREGGAGGQGQVSSDTHTYIEMKIILSLSEPCAGGGRFQPSPRRLRRPGAPGHLLRRLHRRLLRRRRSVAVREHEEGGARKVGWHWNELLEDNHFEI